jgi:iron complex outermembrane receptor protein
MKKYRHSSHAAARVLAVAAIASTTTPTYAQTASKDVASSTVEEIIVTATRREERLQDVPVAVSAITAEDIQTRGFTQFTDYLNSIPGVHFTDAGPGYSAVRIRGLSVAEEALPPTVATYFGEAPISAQTNWGSHPNLRLVDIDRVEVLRGPQGTLFGANALSGAVRIIPAAPSLDQFEVNVGVRGFTTDHADDASYHAEAAINLPLVTDRFAVRLVGYVDDIAGFVDNEVAARPAQDYSESLGLPPGTLVNPALPAIARSDVNGEDTVGGRVSALWQVTDQFKVDFMYTKQTVKLAGEPHATLGAGDYVQRRSLDAWATGEREESFELANLVARYDWTGASLVSSTSWSDYEFVANRDVSSFAQGAFGVPLPWLMDDHTGARALTQELRLQSPTKDALQWLVGLYYQDRVSDYFQGVPDYSCPTCLSQLLTGDDFVIRADGDFSEQQLAAFGEISYNFSERWTAGVGARWLQQKSELDLNAPEGFLGNTATASKANESLDEFNPSAYVRFKANESVTFYLQAARGFRSGVANQALATECMEEAQAVGVQPITDPDTLWNYEVGMKSSLVDGRLTLNAAVYKADWKGIQMDPDLSCGFGVTINAGDASGKGAEIELVGQLAQDWRVNLSAAYNRTQFEDVRPETGFVRGQRLPGSPEKNFSAGIEYGFAHNSNWPAFVRADYVYVGDIAFNAGEQPAYGLTNLRLGVVHGDLGIDLYGRNITDERAILAWGSVGAGSPIVLNRPREIGVEVRYRYR